VVCRGGRYFGEILGFAIAIFPRSVLAIELRKKNLLRIKVAYMKIALILTVRDKSVMLSVRLLPVHKHDLSIVLASRVC